MAGVLSSFVSGVRAKFKNVYSSIVQEVGGFLGRDRWARRGIVRVEQVGLEDAVAEVGALLRITSDSSVSLAQIDVIAQRAIERLSEAVEPISRTGRLSRSFRSSMTSDGAEIYSTEGYARSLLEENAMAQPPPVEELLDWMSTKPDFSGLDPKAARRVAFAIRNSIKTGTGLGKIGRASCRARV